MLGITDQEDTFHSVEGCTAKVGKRVDGCCGALGVALEDEAFVWVGGKGGFDVIYDLASCQLNIDMMVLIGKSYVLSAFGGVLIDCGSVYSVVLFGVRSSCRQPCE